MDPEEVFDLAIAFDENFLVPFYALLSSIFLNHREKRFFFHVIATGLSENEQQEVKTYVEQNNGQLRFYRLTAADLKGLVIPPNGHYTVAAYYRLFFPRLVPESVKKLLYLDTDLVVNQRLDGLFAKELGRFPVAAVAEVNATASRPDLGLYEKGTYFNSGVMLMNLPEWKRQHVTEEALQFIHDFPEKIVFADQDALNVVLQSNYLPLEGRYNVIYQDIPENKTDAEYRQFIKDKVIIHYTLKDKPWNPLCRNRLRFLYFHYLKLSPKANSKKYFHFEQTPRRAWWFVKLRVKEAIYNHPSLAKSLQTLHLF